MDLHVYWILKEQITTEEWKPYAEKFKKLCHEHGLVIDPGSSSRRRTGFKGALY
jgi:hypothetical protein